MHIKKGDNVIVLAGKDKGKTGKITVAMPKYGKVVIEGLNTIKKHQKPTRQGQKGAIVERSMPIDASNVALKK